MFSKRVPADLRPNSIARALEAKGGVRYDLTESNPTRCGFEWPPDLLRVLSSRDGLTYRPDPLGHRVAREAVASHYHRRGVTVDPERILLTASTSEAYGFLFKLLCDPGETVLFPSPSYPLFEHLARLEGLRTRSYALDPDARWQPGAIDPGDDRPRALVAVHPNNPTGTYLHEASADEVVRFCDRHDMALVVDEVFFDYGYDLGESGPPSGFAGRNEVLTFTLGGLSKSLGLPQLKLSWIVVSGPDDRVAPALERLSFVADNYLTVSTPVQLALPELLRIDATLRDPIHRRCSANLWELTGEVVDVPGVRLIEPDGGWSACLRFPAVIDEETLALELIEKDDVAVHPGYFFDFPGEGYLVISLLPAPAVFIPGIRLLLLRLATHGV
jgi:aspartate/methionine/tyrosine aminotransferase